MKRLLSYMIVTVMVMSGSAFGATVFFKDGTKETGNSVWIEGNSVFLSKAKESYEFSADEVLMDETKKINKIGAFADVSLADTDRSASSGSPRVNDLVEQIMAGSSTDRQIDQLVEQFSAGAMQSAGPNSELFAEALAGFDGKKAKQKIRAYYRSHLDAKTLEAILAWSKSPLGVKIREAEAARAVNSPEVAQQLMNGQDESSLPPHRRALIKELDKSGRATEMAIQMVTDAMSGAMAAIPAKTAEQKQARKEIEKQAAMKKDELLPEMRRMVLASLAYTYSELSDDDLKAYAAFMNTDAARKFTKATMGAIGEMTRAMSASMIKKIVKATEQQTGR